MRFLLAACACACLGLLSCGGDQTTSDQPDAASGAHPDGGARSDAASQQNGDMAQPPAPMSCDDPVERADTSKPTTTVGDGTPTSCDEAHTAAAIKKGGVVTFNCGAEPITIALTAPIDVATDTVIDGGNKVTLSGGGKTRILHIKSAWNVATPLLTVQDLAFTGGYTTDVMNTTSTAQGGAAIFEDGGSLTVIHCTFTDNHCAATGQDVSGGAINGQGIGTLIIEDSTFDHNSGSNGGAVGTQDENVTVVNTVFTNNSATGTGGNPGNGGDGGALSYDGAKIPLTLCGDRFAMNHANQAGGAIFRVAYNDEPTTIDLSTFDGNSVDLTVGLAGGLYLEDTHIVMRGTTISNNSAWYGGGFWIGHAAVAELTNVTVAGNQAQMGGGIWFAGMVSGTFLNVTVAGNMGDGLFGGDANVVLQNTLVAANTSHNCTATHGMGGANMQYPKSPGMLCSPSVTIADPILGTLADNGGPTKTMATAMGSPAIGKGTSCPPTDQRGHPRPTNCTLGAYEP
jgi:hypothetical protein